MAGETLAILLLAMKSLRKAKGGIHYEGVNATLPVDSERVSNEEILNNKHTEKMRS
jgi:hypothetical protein